MIDALNPIAMISDSLKIGSQNGGHSAQLAGFNVERGNGAHGATTEKEDICCLCSRGRHDESSQELVEEQKRRVAQHVWHRVDANNVYSSPVAQ